MFIIRSVRLCFDLSHMSTSYILHLSISDDNKYDVAKDYLAKLSIINNERRSTMEQDRFVSLSLLSIEYEILNTLNIDKFANEKARIVIFH